MPIHCSYPLCLFTVAIHWAYPLYLAIHSSCLARPYITVAWLSSWQLMSFQIETYVHAGMIVMALHFSCH